MFDAVAWEDAKDQDIVPPNPSLAEAGGTIWKADNLADLAVMAGLDPEALTQTVARHNDAIRDGGLDALDPPRTNSPYEAKPISTAPYRAVPLCAGITVTMGGIAIDGAARVVRPDDTPITGLYAAGSCVGGIEGGPRAGYVGGLIKAFLLGLVAAESAATDIDTNG